MDVNELLSRVGDELPHLHSGKVRESYRLRKRGGRKPRLVVVTDRRSIFDFPLGFTVKNVGIVLNINNIYYRQKLDEAGIAHDLIAFGAEIDRYLPKALRGIPELQARAMVVEELEMIPVEAVVRNYLTGSGWTLYKENDGIVCGQQLPAGLFNGAPLPDLTFTPTTKAQEGHDEPMDVAEAEAIYPGLGDRAHELFSLVREDVQRPGMFIFADGKAEAGLDRDHVFKWGDEIGTPDASRFWLASDYDRDIPDKLPPSWDKELIRDWGRKHGVNKLDPKNPEARAHVLTLQPTRDELYGFELRNYEFLVKSKHWSYPDYLRDRMGIRWRA